MSVTLTYLLSFCEQNRASLNWTLSRALISFSKNGSQATLVYSSFGRTRDVYATSFTLFGQFQRLRWIVPSDLFALAAVMETWADHLSSLLEVIPRYGKLSTCSNSTPQKTYFLWGGLFLYEMVTVLHLEGLNSICQWYCQDSSPCIEWIDELIEGHSPHR